MNKVLVIAGPTASGKTGLAVELALKCGGEVVSADSMQIYRHMDIGTAKPSLEERKGVTHHMIDIAEPTENYSVAQYKSRASDAIDGILAACRLPIVAGGTGLYINSLVYNIEFAETASDPELRAALQAEAAASPAGPAALHARLAAADPEAAARLHPNDVKRVIRALEVFLTTGSTISRQLQESRLNPSPYDFVIVGLNMDRELLYRRIETRVDRMIESGLEDEVRALLRMGTDPASTAMQGLGYKQMLAVVNGTATVAEAAAEIKLQTRHYAKRQFTWFRKLENIVWIDIGEHTPFEEILDKSLAVLANHR